MSERVSAHAGAQCRLEGVRYVERGPSEPAASEDDESYEEALGLEDAAPGERCWPPWQSALPADLWQCVVSVVQRAECSPALAGEGGMAELTALPYIPSAYAAEHVRCLPKQQHCRSPLCHSLRSCQGPASSVLRRAEDLALAPRNERSYKHGQRT
jgi:hypothetical protein